MIFRHRKCKGRLRSKRTDFHIFQVNGRGWVPFAGCPECGETVYAEHCPDGYPITREGLLELIAGLEFWPAEVWPFSIVPEPSWLRRWWCRWTGGHTWETSYNTGLGEPGFPIHDYCTKCWKFRFRNRDEEGHHGGTEAAEVGRRPRRVD